MLDKPKPTEEENIMVIRYIIHFSHKQFCRCFSDSDLAVNVKFALKEGYKIVSLERVEK